MELLPAPVWPTSATRLAGPHVQVEARAARLAGFAVAEAHALEADLARAARGTGSVAVCTTTGSASISAKTRSTAARPACTWLQKDDRLMSGKKKASMLWMNRNQAPSDQDAGHDAERARRTPASAMPTPIRMFSTGKTVDSTSPRRRLMP